MTTVCFGRSGTVPATITGADVAPAVRSLREVSITGAEYPSLYQATAHIVAEMLVPAAERRAAFYTPKMTRAPWIISNISAETPDEEAENEQRAETGEPWITYRVLARLPQVTRTALGSEVETAGTQLWTHGRFVLDVEEAQFTRSYILLQADPFVDEDVSFKLLWAGASVDPEVREADARAEDPSPEPPSLIDLAEDVGAIPADEITSSVALTGNLTRDVLALTGFTAAELAGVVGRTERSVRQWIADDHVPDSMTGMLQQLRTIALRLVGGLGPRGVRAWLVTGNPSPAGLIATGNASQVLAETERLLDSPAT
jgi:hypothetical protein